MKYITAIWPVPPAAAVIKTVSSGIILPHYKSNKKIWTTFNIKDLIIYNTVYKYKVNAYIYHKTYLY